MTAAQVLAIIERHGFGGSRAMNAALDIAQQVRAWHAVLVQRAAQPQHAHDGNSDDPALD